MSLGNVLIFGDSYSTFKGYIPDNYDCDYDENGGFHDYDIYDVSETWWHQVITKTGSNLVLNDSWSGSPVGYIGHGLKDCSETCSFIYRWRNYVKEGFFEKNKIDTVLVFGGTNDAWCNAPLGELKTENIEEKDLYTALPAMVYFVDMVRETLPDAKIYCIINYGIKDEIVNALEIAAKKNNATSIKLHDFEKICNHPSKKGMESIATQVLEYMK